MEREGRPPPPRTTFPLSSSPLLRAAAFTLTAAAVATASTARADPPATDDAAALRLPVPEAQRPVTLPRFVVAPEIGFDADRQGDVGTYSNLDVSVGAGITDDFAVHALVAPLQLWAPGTVGGFQYGQATQNHGPAVGARYRFVRGSVEIAVALTGHVFTVPGLSGGSVIPSVPIRFHASENVRFDVVPTVNFWIATQEGTATQLAPSSANAVRVMVPVSARANVTQAFDVGLSTGLTVYDASRAGDTTGIPLGAFLGYAVAGKSGPVLDVDPYFTLPYLLMPWRRSSDTNTNQYVVGVNVTGYLYL